MSRVCTVDQALEGFVRLEISNTAPLPAPIYTNEGPLPDSLFFQSDEQCKTSEKDERGKYQGRRTRAAKL